MTEVKQVQAYILRIREDMLIDSCFCEILTPELYMEVKLPSKVDDYRYKPLINFGFLLQLDLIKTRKHWIVTHIEALSKLRLSTWEYSQFELLTQMNRVLVKHLHIDQECHLHPLVKGYLRALDVRKYPSSGELLHKFEEDLMSWLGFK